MRLQNSRYIYPSIIILLPDGFTLPQRYILHRSHLSHRLHVLSPAPPPSPIRSLGYRAAMIWMRAEAASTSYSLPLPPPFILSLTRPEAPSLGILAPLPISVPTSPPPLLLPSASGAPVGTDTELGRHMTAFETRVRQDTDEVYTRDRRAHARTARLMETEARMSRDDLGDDSNGCDVILAHVVRFYVHVAHFISTGLRCQDLESCRDADRRRQAFSIPLIRHDNNAVSTERDQSQKTIKEAVEMATELMDARKVILMAGKTDSENKRIVWKHFPKHQNPTTTRNKRQNTGRAYTAGTGETEAIRGHLNPLRCGKCNNQRGTGSGPKPTCFDVWESKDITKRECPKADEQSNNRGNHACNDSGSSQSCMWWDVLGTNPDSQISRDGYVPSQQPLCF
ncbi:hypothetical protein Tco_1054243 [Tanacetum coccineum]|uniref:Uncharacterized protein n=1 Tax=Tanacetum coccineum TaxID=301880 RepID=A0ABQ5GXG1_9ASTR